MVNNTLRLKLVREIHIKLQVLVNLDSNRVDMTIMPRLFNTRKKVTRFPTNIIL